MGFSYPYMSLATEHYKGYSIRKTWSRNRAGKYIYQINDEPIDAPIEKMELTTLKKVKEYIDRRIENRNRIISQITDIAAENENYRIWVSNDGDDCHLHIDIKL